MGVHLGAARRAWGAGSTLRNHYVLVVPLQAEPLWVIFLLLYLWSAGVLTPWIF